MHRVNNLRSATINDVARRAHVSPTTASIVARGQQKKRHISAETATRVQAAMEELHYVPNRFARALRKQRSGTIGVIVANLKMNWAEAVMDAMLAVLRPSGYAAFLTVHRFDAELAYSEVVACLHRRDEGVIFQPMPGMNSACARVLDAGVPLVFLGDRPTDMPTASFVGWDAGPAARVAVEHLITTGRRRIGFVGLDYPMEMSQRRYQAYVGALREAGLLRDERWIANAPSNWALDRIIRWSVNRLFAPGREHPDAVFALNDGLALPLLDALDARGIRVPEDVAVIGMGDLSMTGRCGIGLSTVREPVEEIGHEVASLMLDLIANRRTGPITRPIPGQELKRRHTTHVARDEL